MAKDILQTLDQCEVCEQFRTTKPPPKSVLPREDGEPYKKWAINVIGPMPKNSKGYRFIITAVDFCTRQTVVCASKVYDHTDISLFIRQEIKHKFGEPSIMMSDCGQDFILKNFKPT